MQLIARVVFSSLLLACLAEASAWRQPEGSIDLFVSMDDTREALMELYNLEDDEEKPLYKAKPHYNLEDDEAKPLYKLEPQYKLEEEKEEEKFITSSRFRSEHWTLMTLRLNKAVTTKAPVLVTPVPRPSPRKRASTNKFVEAIEDIEKALAEAQQTDSKVTHDTRRLRRLQDLIKAAVKKRSYRFARKTIGEAMFTITKIKEMSKGTVISTKDFLRNVKKTIGVSAFSKLLAMQGEVTLMFAMDTTGSMGEEIGTAKKIAESIVNKDRSEPVDYILSPFSDPGEN